MTQDRVVYKERSPWPQWVNLIVWGSFIGISYPLLAGWGTDSSFESRIAKIVAFLLVYVGLEIVVGGSTVHVRSKEVVVFLGRVPLIKKRMAFADIVSLESVRYHPIREFGGWGVRGLGAKQAWTARGDQAVVLHLVSGKQIYVGSDHPHRLEERIRATAGDQLGKNA